MNPPVLTPLNPLLNHHKSPMGVTEGMHSNTALPPPVLAPLGQSTATIPPVSAPAESPMVGNTMFTVPNAVIDARPAFTPHGYHQWRREVKLWIAAQAGATITQLMDKMISCLPMSVRMDAMTYMEQTESKPHTRDSQSIFDLLGARFGKTDTEKSRMWLSQFTDFKRSPSENFKDFWSRYNRTIAMLQSLGVTVNEEVIPHKAAQALRLPEVQLPIVLSALRTMNASTSVQSLGELAIKMYETHRPITDHADVYQAQTEDVVGNESCPENETMDGGEEVEIVDANGQIFLTKPKRNPRRKIPQWPRNPLDAGLSARSKERRQLKGIKEWERRYPERDLVFDVMIRIAGIAIALFLSNKCWVRKRISGGKEKGKENHRLKQWWSVTMKNQFKSRKPIRPKDRLILAIMRMGI